MNPNGFNFRVAIAVFVAASVGFSIALVSLSKVFLVIVAVIALLLGKPVTPAPAWRTMWTPAVVLMVIFAFSVSLLWTTAPMDQALGAVGKYGKFH